MSLILGLQRQRFITSVCDIIRSILQHNLRLSYNIMVQVQNLILSIESLIIFLAVSHRNRRCDLNFDSLVILSMSKQAVLMLVDVGHSMDEPFSDTASRAKIALQCCKMTLQQKIFNNSSHELGLILFGDNDSDDGNSLLLQNLEKPTVDFVRKVEQLSHAKFENTSSGGDIFSSINYGLNILNDHCKKKKYNKRMFLFTNGAGNSSFSMEQIPDLAAKLGELQIKLNVIPIDFMVSYDPTVNELEGQMLMQKPQEENAQMLMRLKREADDFVQIFPASLAIELYKRFRKKDTNPVARYKGVLQFAPGLQIEVSTYKAIRKYDASVAFDPIIPKEKEVIIETNYIMQGDQSGKIVDPENIINAYNYGPQLVPISPILEAGSKIFEDKNLRLLGFVDKSKVPRHAFMGDVDIVVPSSQNLMTRKLFSAFIYSMLSLNRYGLARYVPRNNKNGVTPKMVVLIPYRSAEREMFYLIELPTVEDVRQYPFNPLKESSSDHKELVRNLIDRMMLYNSEGEEEVKVENTFNPLRQYFYQSIFYRALNDAEDLPPLDPVIKNYITPQQKKYPKTEPLMGDIKKAFKLTRKLNLVDRSMKKKTIVWKDVIEELNSTKEEQAPVKEEEIEEQELQYVKPNSKFLFEDEEDQMAFNPANPITSFRKMINYNKEDLVSKALADINHYILNKLSFVVTEEAYKHLSECAAEMRNACVSQQEEKYWDQWFTDIGYNNPSFFAHLKAQGLGLIKGNNSDIFKVQELHHEQLEDVLCDLD